MPRRRALSSEMKLNYGNTWKAYQMPRPTALMRRVHDNFKRGKRLNGNVHDDENLGKPQTHARATATAKLKYFLLRAKTYAISPFSLVPEYTVHYTYIFYGVLGNRKKPARRTQRFVQNDAQTTVNSPAHLSFTVVLTSRYILTSMISPGDCKLLHLSCLRLIRDDY